jgi:prepilin-type processing-associated H-X9-DG protein
VDTEYNISGLNDTFMAPGDDPMVQGWLSQVGGNPRMVIPGPDGVGPFWDTIAGFHHAPTGNKLGGRGNCAFLDGHIDPTTAVKLSTSPGQNKKNPTIYYRVLLI